MTYILYKSLEDYLQLEPKTTEQQLMQGMIYNNSTRSLYDGKRLKVKSLTFHQLYVEDSFDGSTMRFIFTYDTYNPVKVVLSPNIG